MFEIEWLMPPEIQDLLENTKGQAAQAEILTQLIEYSDYFPQYADEIAENWKNNCDETYSEIHYALDKSDKELVTDLAVKCHSLEEAKELINMLCGAKDGIYDYDTVIADAVNKTNTVQRIDDFEFTDELTKIANGGVRPSIETLLGIKINGR